MAPQAEKWIASRSLSSGAHSRDPLARNDGGATHATLILRRPRSGRLEGWAAGAIGASWFETRFALLTMRSCYFR
jgi:hypothetical protein